MQNLACLALVSVLAFVIGALCTLGELREAAPDESLLQASLFICVAGVIGMCAAMIWGGRILWETM